MGQPVSQPTNHPIILHSNRLVVQIALPGSVYRGTRFDWTGFITQVTLDGVHTFCTSESLQANRGTGGIGLCNEFGNEKPIGYIDAKPGEAFPKPGIGLLQRPKASQYSFMYSYNIIQPFPVSHNATPDMLSIQVDPIDCRGYAIRLKKTFTVKDNWLQILYELENTGNKTIDTHEYCHNFISIDGQIISPDYHLHLPYPIKMEKITASYRSMLPGIVQKIVPVVLIDKLIDSILKRGLRAVVIVGDDLSFRYSPETWFYLSTSGFNQSQGPQWEIKLRSSGAGLREYDDFAPAKVAIWGDKHVISAEVFIDLLLQPGEVKTWLRRYEFFI